MDDWNDLRVLVAVRREGSLARAGRALGMDKATVSRRLRALEAAVRQPVLERRASGGVLTATGHRLADAGAAMEGALATALAEIGQAAVDVVRVTAPPWFARVVLIPALARLAETAPGVQVRLVSTNSVVDLVERDADLAIRNVRPVQQRLVVRTLGALGSAIYAVPGRIHALAAEPGRERQRVAEAPWVGYENAVTFVPGFLWLAGSSVVFRATDTMALLEAARAGLGLAVLPCLLGDAESGLCRAPVPVESETIYLVSHEEVRGRPAVRTVATWIAEAWSSRAEALAGRAGEEGGER